MKNIRIFLFLLLALALAGFAEKMRRVSVTFHVETNARDTGAFAIPVKLKNPPRQTFIEKMPSITEQEIQAIYPFPANDGTMGCAFMLDDHGRVWLDTLSVEHLGRSLVAFVDGRQVSDVLIDKRVSDGIITIPYGLTNNDIASLKGKYPIIGQHKLRKEIPF